MMSSNKKIIFFGTPDFTIDFLEELSQNNLIPSIIVTTPDRAAGRGLNILSPAPKKWAEENNIKTLQPEKLDNDFLNKISKEEWDLFVVIAYGKILPEKLIKLPRFGTINVHYSLLPVYRGATPVESAILNGDQMTGVTIQQMAYKLDSGDILAQVPIEILPNDNVLTLRNRLNLHAKSLLIKTIDNIFNKDISPIKQNDSEVTYCSKLNKNDGLIDLSGNAEINYRKFRAYSLWPGTFFFLNRNNKEIRVKIRKARLERNSFVVEEVVPESGRPMSFAEFLRWSNT